MDSSFFFWDTLYKRNRCDSNYRKFSELRSRCKLAISEAYDNYLAGVESDLLAKPKTFGNLFATIPQIIIFRFP
jgi:hypothetical protein